MKRAMRGRIILRSIPIPRGRRKPTLIFAHSAIPAADMSIRVRRTALVAAAVVTAGLAAAFLVREFRGRQPQNDLAELVAAVGTSLPFDARLSGGFPPSTHEVRRSAVPSPN